MEHVDPVVAAQVAQAIAQTAEATTGAIKNMAEVLQIILKKRPSRQEKERARFLVIEAMDRLSAASQLMAAEMEKAAQAVEVHAQAVDGNTEVLKQQIDAIDEHTATLNKIAKQLERRHGVVTRPLHKRIEPRYPEPEAHDRSID